MRTDPLTLRHDPLEPRPSASAGSPASTSDDAALGRDALRPGDIPDAGWRDVLVRLRRRVVADQLSITAAGAAFYALIATFPALTVLFGVYGLLFTPREIEAQLVALQGGLPPQALHLVAALIEGLAQSTRWRLSLGIGAGLLVTLWGASLGVRALMKALNLAYGEQERRGFLRRFGLALVMTFGAIVIAFVIAAATFGVPVAERWLEVDPRWLAFLRAVRWPTVAFVFWLALLVLYRYGPSRARARWSWVSWGAFAATLLWLSGSALLSWYASGSDTYYKAYGPIGFVVILLLWFLLSAYAVLVGAELNAELERQTRRDTTVGADAPLGGRGAAAADSIGAAPPATGRDPSAVGPARGAG